MIGAQHEQAKDGSTETAKTAAKFVADEAKKTSVTVVAHKRGFYLVERVPGRPDAEFEIPLTKDGKVPKSSWFTVKPAKVAAKAAAKAEVVDPDANLV